jgi:release factor glutamine methyltransferase
VIEIAAMIKCRTMIPDGAIVRVGELLHKGIIELEDAGVPEAATDTNLLLGHCLSKSRTQLYLSMEETVTAACERQFLELLARRKRREPVAYILGEREFWSLPFQVTSDVLIPRPETEFLLETVLKTIKMHGLADGPLLDLCCGSGVIGIVLALELQKKVVAADLSRQALVVAQQNARRHGVEGLVDFVQADLLSSMLPGNRFSLVVANPPYVSSNEMRAGLAPEVVRYEPHLALDGGEDGLEIIRKIKDGLPLVLCLGGYFFMEIGAGQGEKIRKIFSGDDDSGNVFDQVEIYQDYAGRDRVLYARFIQNTRK